ncbi:hypothetical protein Tco_0351401 [Tanacetum coccineum]
MPPRTIRHRIHSSSDREHVISSVSGAPHPRLQTLSLHNPPDPAPPSDSRAPGTFINSLDQTILFHPLLLYGNSYIDAPNLNSFNDPPNVFTHPPQPQYETYSCELCGNDSHYGFDCPPRFPLEKLNKALQAMYEKLNQQEQTANVSTHTPEPSRHFKYFYDDDEESTIPLNEITSQISLSSVEDLVLIPSGNFVTFSNPLFDANDDFTSSDDESLPEEDDSYVSNLDEPALLVTPFSDANKDGCFDPRGDIDEIDAFLDIDVSMDIEDGYHDSEGDIIYLE